MSQIKIESVSSVGLADWNSSASNCDATMYFHTPQWAEIWFEYSQEKMQPCAKLITFSDGKQTIFPMSKYPISKGLQEQYISAVGWMCGGWFSKAKLTPDHHKAVWDYCGKINLIIRQNPFDEEVKASNLNWACNEVTQAVDLRDGFDTVYAKWEHGKAAVLRNLKIAKKAEIVVEPAQTLAEWREYFEVYQNTMTQWKEVKGLVFKWEIFEKMYSLQSPNIILWVAKQNGKILSGTVCLYHNKIVAGWHGSTLREYSKSMPGYAVDCHIIEDSCKKGLSWYDLGTSVELPGLAQYKHRLGAIDLTCNLHVNKTFARKSLELIRQKSQKLLQNVKLV
jgi:Acetyltransferase (GNAT) domain